MKRATNMPESEWQVKMKERKTEAARDMFRHDASRGFLRIKDIEKTSRYYNCSQHEAECRLQNEFIDDDLCDILMAL